MAGIEIFNPSAGDSGTLGFFVEEPATGDVWLVSCYHVLCRPNGAAAPDGEPVYQAGVTPGMEIAQTDVPRSDSQKDYALAKLLATSDSRALGIGPIVGSVVPAVGMRVVKSGASTGVTDGIVERVDLDRITISIPTFYPPDYDVSERGDSGAPWIEQATGRIVGMHLAGTTFGPDKAFALPLASILGPTQLTLKT